MYTSVLYIVHVSCQDATDATEYARFYNSAPCPTQKAGMRDALRSWDYGHRGDGMGEDARGITATGFRTR